MYSDEELQIAVEKGIFTRQAVAEFRDLVAAHGNISSVDDENFRLISGFNDIFVVIASILFLSSAAWLVEDLHRSMPTLLVAALSWGLAEFFVLRRKMALPAIVLLIAFAGGVFYACFNFFDTPDYADYPGLAIATFAVCIMTGLHWYRFRVPITVAAGVVAIIGFIIATVLWSYPQPRNWILAPLFICGVATFAFAMYWDSTDLGRTSHRSDVAFWLHLVAAPMIIHPVFSTLSVFDRTDNLFSTGIVLSLYVLMTAISLIINRRAFMVSSLVYVLYAITSLLRTYGVIDHSFAITGIFLGSALLLLSGFWHKARARLVKLLPSTFSARLPAIH